MIHDLIGRGIEVVIVDGNHDSPAQRLHAGSPMDYLREFGAQVVNSRHTEIIGTDARPWRSARLRGRLAVHGLPYNALLESNFSGVGPLPGLQNVLVVHGRVGGVADLPDVNTLGLRSAAVPAEVLRRGWDYVALGDWHIHGFRPLSDVSAFYSGSLEAMNFGEAMSYPPRKDDSYAVGGALDVVLSPGAVAVVASILNERRRPLLRLHDIDAEGLDAHGLLAQMRQRLDRDFPAEALVRLSVRRCRHQTWDALDHEELASLRARFRRCEILPEWEELAVGSLGVSSVPIEDQWEAYLAEQIPDEAERSALLASGRTRIEAARQAVQRARVAAGDADAE